MFSKYRNTFDEDFNFFPEKENDYLLQSYDKYKVKDELSFDFFKECPFQSSFSDEYNQLKKHAEDFHSQSQNVSQNNSKSTNITDNKPFAEISLYPKDLSEENNKNNLFKTNQEKLKHPNQGRIKKADKNIYAGEHDRFSDNNIVIKVKSYLSNNIVDFINFKYGLQHPGEKTMLVYPINRSIIKNIYGEENRKWINMKIKDFLSQKRSSRFKGDPLENVKNIQNFLKKEGEKDNELIDIFEMQISDFYELYISDEKEENFMAFKNLKDDLKSLEEEMKSNDESEKEISDYLIEFENVAKKLKEIIKNKKCRKKKIKIIN